MIIAEFAAAHVAGIVSCVGVVVAIVLALRQLRHQRKLAAQRATLDFISKFEVHDQRWMEICREFTSLRSGNRLGSLVHPTKEEQDENGPEKKAKLHAERERNRILVVTFLNHFECVAVAIRHDIIDEALYKEWFRGAYIRAWDDAHSFVIDLRQRKGKENPKLFVQFEELAEKWKDQKA